MAVAPGCIAHQAVAPAELVAVAVETQLIQEEMARREVPVMEAVEAVAPAQVPMVPTLQGQQLDRVELVTLMAREETEAVETTRVDQLVTLGAVVEALRQEDRVFQRVAQVGTFFSHGRFKTLRRWH